MLSQSEIKNILQTRVEKYQQSVGIVVGIVSAEKSFSVGYGYPDKASKIPVDDNTIFEIGSITKVFTGLLLADMAANGEVAFGDPIARYLPEHVKAPNKNGAPITLMHLATHTSGLPRLPGNLDPVNSADPYADYSVDDLYDFLNHYVPEHEPDELWEYSNLGMGLLGHLLERMSGRSFEELVRERICEPLDMQDTYINLPVRLAKHRATGHNEALEPVPDWHIPTLAGAGALRSSVNDLVKFLSFNLGHTSSLYASAKRTHQTYEKEPSGTVAMGWNIIASKRERGEDILWHNGGTGGFRSFIAFKKQSREGVVVLSNAENSVDDLGLHLLDPDYPLRRFDFNEISLAPSALNKYVGDYEIRPDLILSVFVENGRLLTQASNQATFEIFPETETFFFVKEFDAQLTFQKDESGDVSGLVLHQHGHNTFAPKVTAHMQRAE